MSTIDVIHENGPIDGRLGFELCNGPKQTKLEVRALYVRKYNKQIHNKHSQKSQTNLLKGPLKVSIKDYFPDDEFSVKLPHLSTNGTCYELPPDILEDEHPIAIAIAPARKKRQRYCKHEDFGTCGHSCCAMQIVAPKDCDTKSAMGIEALMFPHLPQVRRTD